MIGFVNSFFEFFRKKANIFGDIPNRNATVTSIANSSGNADPCTEVIDRLGNRYIIHHSSILTIAQKKNKEADPKKADLLPYPTYLLISALRRAANNFGKCTPSAVVFQRICFIVYKRLTIRSF